MQNFREFQAGPDPFGRQYRVLFKWLQTAISLRHADTVDVKFVLTEEGGLGSEKTIALPHPELLRVSAETGRPMDDPWCARLAQSHLLYLIRTGEDMEKDLITVGYADLMRYAREVAREEKAALPAG
jgi:hypothetical protein